MNIVGLSCCAVGEITGLNFHGTNAKNAMLDFCKGALRRSRSRYVRNPVTGTSRYVTTYSKQRPGAFYIFTGIVELKKTEKFSKDYKLGYVEAFKKFIEDNDLGEVSMSSPEWNRIGAPKHKDVVCVWRPKVGKLVKWYEDNKEKE